MDRKCRFRDNSQCLESCSNRQRKRRRKRFRKRCLRNTSASETSNHQYSGSGVNIGNRYASTWGPFDGFISNVRIVKGTAVYTGNFTPSTSPLTNVTNTVNLGLRLNRFADSVSSVVPYLNTTSGPIKIQPFSPFAPSYAYDPAVHGGIFMVMVAIGLQHLLRQVVISDVIPYNSSTWTSRIFGLYDRYKCAWIYLCSTTVGFPFDMEQ